MSVRTRVLAAVIALTTLALVVAGATAYGLERSRLDQRLDDSLERSVEEFRTLARDGVDPSTGEAFTDVRELLKIALQRTVPSPNEGMFALVGSEIAWTLPTTVRLRLEDDVDLVAAVADASSRASATIRRVTTETADYRVVVVPLTTTPPGEAGALVLAVDRGAEHAALAESYRSYVLVALGAILAIAVVGWFTVGRLLEPIKLLRSTAQEISSSDLSRRIPVMGNDDLAVLTETVNGMLDRLEESFTSQRELLDDVGHELRTPLTIVRGHLELMDPADPTDTAATKDLALDEVDRMSLLVEDLVTLAKARRPDFVIRRPTDVALLTDEVLTKAGPLGDRRWVLDELADVTVEVDPQRLTQALLQLASNAVKFSAAGSTVALGSAVRAGELYLWVRDEGVGIDAADQDRVFDRFERLQPGVEGSGLGLTIVRSIAAAHRGRVEVDSTLGDGTTVLLILPMTEDDDAGRDADEPLRPAVIANDAKTPDGGRPGPHARDGEASPAPEHTLKETP